MLTNIELALNLAWDGEESYPRLSVRVSGCACCLFSIAACLAHVYILLYICSGSSFRIDNSIFLNPQIYHIAIVLNFIFEELYAPVKFILNFVPIFEGTCLPVENCQESFIDLVTSLSSFAQVHHKPPLKETNSRTDHVQLPLCEHSPLLITPEAVLEEDCSR